MALTSLVTLLSSAAVAQSSAVDLVSQAIARAGGRQALEAHQVLEWRGHATVHIPNRKIEIAGEWEVQPDSAVVTTWPLEQPAAPRRLILSRRGGWTQRGATAPAPMPPELLMEERHQFYLYQLLRLVPLLDGGFALAIVAGDSQPVGLRVSHPDHPDVTLYFDREHRVVELRTVFAAPDMTDPESQEIHLSGEVEFRGVRWFSKLRILRGGKPYFDLEITDFRASPRQ